MTYSLTGSYPELAMHIRDAQASGLPSTLTRLIDPDLQQANRNRACGKSVTRPDGLSCDEYPFASTYQGAAMTPGGPRTFPYCAIILFEPQSTGPEGYSICMIVDRQNSGGGAVLGGMYRSNRVLDGDPFRVAVST